MPKKGRGQRLTQPYRWTLLSYSNQGRKAGVEGRVEVVWAGLSLPSVLLTGAMEHPLTTVSFPLPPYYVLKATEMFSQFRRGNGLWRIIKQQK